ncbi:MAG TPA: imidazolonepropionase [Caulobacteraceae bacterium]|jgi:imidazolonepropionase
MRCDAIWRNARLATLAEGAPGLGEIDHGLVACREGRILYVGTEAEAPSLDASRVHDCEGRWITPGLIDCHTHLVFAGDRAGEFERRLAGETYEAIAREGGGILSTVRATRGATCEALVETALPRLDALIAEGVTTVEVKSGYGLTLADEMKMLRAAQELGRRRPATVTTTFLGAHTVPLEYKGDSDGYIDLLCDRMIPEIARERLADAVDAFCETIAFSPGQVRRVFDAAKAAGLPVKIHAEQLSDQGGAALAADFGALSADHLEHLDEAGVEAMARAGTVAVLLPGAYYFMRERQPPPIDAFRSRGVPMALATDCNPGTSPLSSILMTLNMAATQFRMTIEECVAGVTRNAARALGLQAEAGTLEAGKRCDLAIWNIEQPAELVYWLGRNPLEARVWGGE